MLMRQVTVRLSHFNWQGKRNLLDRGDLFYGCQRGSAICPVWYHFTSILYDSVNHHQVVMYFRIVTSLYNVCHRGSAIIPFHYHTIHLGTPSWFFELWPHLTHVICQMFLSIKKEGGIGRSNVRKYSNATADNLASGRHSEQRKGDTATRYNVGDCSICMTSSEPCYNSHNGILFQTSSIVRFYLA